MGDPSVSAIETACQWIYFQCIACQRSINSQLFGDIQKVVRIFLPKPVSAEDPKQKERSTADINEGIGTGYQRSVEGL